MLILARKKNQSLRIGDNITVTVLEIQGDQVRLGINAPHDIQILRQELLDAVGNSNQEAAQTARDINVAVLAQMKKLKEDQTMTNNKK